MGQHLYERANNLRVYLADVLERITSDRNGSAGRPGSSASSLDLSRCWTGPTAAFFFRQCRGLRRASLQPHESPSFCGGVNRRNCQTLIERFCAVMVRNWTGALLTSTSINPRRRSTVSSERRAWVSGAPSIQMSIKPDRRHFLVL